MRYSPEHKAETRQKIVADAARRMRSEGMTGAAVSAVMKDAGLTHGGFYKHFKSKDALLLESLSVAFDGVIDWLEAMAQKSGEKEMWRGIVRAYLSPEHCAHAEFGCPVAALGPELARMPKAMKARVPGELEKYSKRMTPYMPGRSKAEKERAFLTIFSTMIGAVEIARLLPDAAAREQVLKTAQDFLLKSY